MPRRILMVCLGNICRSPLAHGVMSDLLPEDIVDSAGTSSYHIGSPPDPRSVSIAKQHNIDITNQTARLFTASHFADFDHIYVMDRQNYRDVISLAQTQNDINKVELLCEAAGLGKLAVPDPYYGGVDGFKDVFDLVKNACLRIKNKWN